MLRSGQRGVSRRLISLQRRQWSDVNGQKHKLSSNGKMLNRKGFPGSSALYSASHLTSWNPMTALSSQVCGYDMYLHLVRCHSTSTTISATLGDPEYEPPFSQSNGCKSR